MRQSALIFLAAVCLASCTTDQNSTPNIILIMADDLGYETLGSSGGTSYETPNLDALAADGMRFTQAHATPLCTPSRVQIMTGKYNFRNYIGFGLLDPDERTFGHYLQQAGYRTAVTGKWQLYGNATQRELSGRSGSLPEQAGFDAYRLWQIQERGLRFKNPHLYDTGMAATTHTGAYGPDLFVEFIEDFVETQSDQPFFLYYPMALTHDPFQPTPDHPDYADFDPGSNVNDTTFFKDNVAYMDGLVGRIVRKIDALGLRENTLLLFVGDNGTDRDVISRMGQQEIRGNKAYTNAAGTHVPMIASWLGTIDPGQVNDNLIDFTDFLPTLLEAAQVQRPPDALDGLSFFPQLLGPTDQVRSWIFCDYAPRWGNFQPRRFVHDKRWKLYGDGSFYDLAADPDEQNALPDTLLGELALEARADFLRVLHRLR